MSIQARQDSVRSDFELNVLKALSRDYAPLSVAAVGRALPVGGRPNASELRLLLAELVSIKKLTHFSGRTERFSIGPVSDWVRGRLLGRLALGPQTESSLKKVLTHNYKSEFEAAAARLVRDGLVFLHPALTGRGKPRYSLVAPDPLQYIVKDLNKILTSGQRLGFSHAQLREAVARGVAKWSPDIHASVPEILVETMRRLEPRIDHGAAVSIPQLRNAIGNLCSKLRFDEAMLELARSGAVELQSHAWPARLTSAEQESMIANGHGGWYDSAGILKGTTQ